MFEKIYAYPKLKPSQSKENTVVSINIIAGREGCELLIFSSETGTIYRLEKYLFSAIHSQTKLVDIIAEILKKDELFPVLKLEENNFTTILPIKEINFVWIDSPFSLAPVNFSDNQNNVDLLKIHSWVGPIEKISSKSALDASINIFFTYPKISDSYFSSLNINVIHHPLMGLQVMLSAKKLRSINTEVFIFQKSGWINLIIFKEGQLQFANHCFVQSKEDIMVYLQKSLNFFKVDSECMTAHYNQEYSASSDLTDALSELKINATPLSIEDFSSKNSALNYFPELWMMMPVDCPLHT